MIATDPAVPTGRTWLNALPPSCHWETNAAASEFSPSESNFTGPCTLVSVTPLWR